MEAINKDNAKELGSKGGKASAEARRRKAAMTPEERARDTIQQKVSSLTKELLNIALAEGDFAESEEDRKEEEGVTYVYLRPAVPAELRFRAITVALQYGLGKPATGKQEAKATALTEGGITLGVAEDDE